MELQNLVREQVKLCFLEDALIPSKNDIETIKEQVSNYVIKEEKEQLNEAVASLAISIALSAPKLIEWLGKAVKFIINQFKKLFGKDTTKDNVGDKILGAGHKLEKFYIKTIKFLIKKTGIAKKAGIKSEEDLDKVAKVLFYVILFGAAIAAGYATIESISSILSGQAGVSTAAYGATKGSLTGIKTSEIIGALSKLKGKLF